TSRLNNKDVRVSRQQPRCYLPDAAYWYHEEYGGHPEEQRQQPTQAEWCCVAGAGRQVTVLGAVVGTR
ncbi:hypothetical protein SFRURICE_001785, partial [Spodoptera frugiperda]